MHHLVLNLSILNHIVTCHYFTIFMQKINKNLAGPTSEECSHCVQCCGSVSRSRFLTLKLQFWFCYRLEPWPGPLLWPRHDLDLELDNISASTSPNIKSKDSFEILSKFQKYLTLTFLSGPCWSWDISKNIVPTFLDAIGSVTMTYESLLSSFVENISKVKKS